MFNVIAFGVTGGGKSTYANILCNANARESDSHNSETTENKFYSGREFRYLDTIGFDDSHGIVDRRIFGDVMKKIFDKTDKGRNFKVDLVLWFIASSNPRQGSSVQKVAQLIQQLNDNERTRMNPKNVWDNTIIILNGKYGNVESVSWSQSVLEAARTASRNGRLELRSFPAVIIDGARGRRSRHHYTRQEIYEKIKQFASQSYSFNIRFIIKKCKNCNFLGDPLFLGTGCHTKPIRAHGETRVHAGGTKKSYLKSAALGGSALGVATGGVGTLAGALGGLAFAALKDPKCKNCGKGLDTIGCLCMLCGQQDYGRKNGCSTVCVDCGNNWSTSKGCSKVDEHKF